jgi:hypothetical protein
MGRSVIDILLHLFAIAVGSAVRRKLAGPYGRRRPDIPNIEH